MATTRMLFLPVSPQDSPGAATAPRGEPSAWMVVPMVVGVIALLVLGLHPPDALTALIARGPRSWEVRCEPVRSTRPRWRSG